MAWTTVEKNKIITAVGQLDTASSAFFNTINVSVAFLDGPPEQLKIQVVSGRLQNRVTQEELINKSTLLGIGGTYRPILDRKEFLTRLTRMVSYAIYTALDDYINKT